MKNILIFTSCILLLTGCVSYDYVGEKLSEPTSSVKVCTDSNAIPQKDYTVLGTAAISGSSQEISREKMLEKLVSEAKECGADIVLVTGHQVIPAATRQTQEFSSSFDYDSTSSSWQTLHQDIDRNYGNVRRRNQPQNVSSYRRIIKAQFIKLAPAKTADVK